MGLPMKRWTLLTFIVTSTVASLGKRGSSIIIGYRSGSLQFDVDKQYHDVGNTLITPRLKKAPSSNQLGPGIHKQIAFLRGMFNKTTSQTILRSLQRAYTTEEQLTTDVQDNDAVCQIMETPFTKFSAQDNVDRLAKTLDTKIANAVEASVAKRVEVAMDKHLSPSSDLVTWGQRSVKPLSFAAPKHKRKTSGELSIGLLELDGSYNSNSPVPKKRKRSQPKPRVADSGVRIPAHWPLVPPSLTGFH
ncbi:hypothetical protein GGR58DRAFT_496800 [Xylaria digitata]|nr:hypothetical protein GGR58DRAFT_496800 [Xylaria digitata]